MKRVPTRGGDLQLGADVFRYPEWRFARWLTHAEAETPLAVRRELVRNLYGVIPIFGGGAISTVAVALVLAMHVGTLPFIIWLAIECVLLLTRLTVVFSYRWALGRGRRPPINGLVVIELVGACSVSFGACASIVSQYPVAMILAGLSAAGMVGETCLRDLGAPRLVTIMASICLVPSMIACAFSQHPMLQMGFVPLALYLYCMLRASHSLSATLLLTMRAERENDYRARHDKLTGLLNRAGLEHEIDMIQADNHNVDLTLFFIDLDGFKSINDRFGHSAGDRLLRDVADSLLATTAASDVVARLGGDEFIVLTSRSATPPGAMATAMLNAIRNSRDVEHRQISITASIGIAQASLCGHYLSDLVNAADTALYRVKENGGAGVATATGPYDRSAIPTGLHS